VLEAIALAVALAMDATAVAAARSVSGVPRRSLMILAFCFGAFQAGMAVGGLVLGETAARWISEWDHWIAFGLLLLIGGKMLFEAIKGGSVEDEPRLDARTIVVLSIATSIDALAAGVTIPMMAAPALLTIVLIGVITFGLSALGAVVGGSLGSRVGKKLEIVGGVVLIGLAIKTLVEHLTA